MNGRIDDRFSITIIWPGGMGDMLGGERCKADAIEIAQRAADTDKAGGQTFVHDEMRRGCPCVWRSSVRAQAALERIQ